MNLPPKVSRKPLETHLDQTALPESDSKPAAVSKSKASKRQPSSILKKSSTPVPSELGDVEEEDDAVSVH